MRSWKRQALALVSAAAVMIAGLTPTSADADHRHRHRGHHHGHWHHNRPYLAGPPIVLRSTYYPVQYYYSPPVWYGYGYFGPYYGDELYYYGW